MCRLRIKIRVIGKKNQEFVRFILVPKDIRQRGRYKTTLGYWDTRQNTNLRAVVMNIYKIMYYYSYGATPNKKVLCQIYNYFVDVRNFNNWSYFSLTQTMLFIEDEIKKKYL